MLQVTSLGATLARRWRDGAPWALTLMPTLERVPLSNRRVTRKVLMQKEKWLYKPLVMGRLLLQHAG